MNKLIHNLCLLGVLLTPVAYSHASVDGDNNAESHEFEVFLEDKKIGTHRVDISRQDEITTVITTANFEYTIFFLPVYTYEHRAVETWRQGCLVDIDTTTDDNGDRFFINSEIDNDGLLISTQDGTKQLDNCVRSYAYWDPALLNSKNLLNTQNGEYQSARIEFLGETGFDNGASAIPAKSYRLTTEEGDIVLWYDAQDRWLALQSRVENGSLIRYVSTRLSDAGGDAS